MKRRNFIKLGAATVVAPYLIAEPKLSCCEWKRSRRCVIQGKTFTDCNVQLKNKTFYRCIFTKCKWEGRGIFKECAFWDCADFKLEMTQKCFIGTSKPNHSKYTHCFIRLDKTTIMSNCVNSTSVGHYQYRSGITKFISEIPNEEGEYIHVQNFIDRVKKAPPPGCELALLMLGTPGNEIWVTPGYVYSSRFSV